MNLTDAANAIADVTLWTPDEAISILKLSDLGITAQAITAPWEEHR